MSKPPLIAAHDIAKTYQQEGGVATHALRPTNLTIRQGEFIAIMGPSGSGKSTLLHILGLLDRPSNGRYLLDDQDTGQLSDAQLAHLRNRRIGFIFQAFHLLPRTAVIDNVALPLQYAHLSRREHVARAEHALARVQLTHRSHHTPAQLSGGEKQRTVIARALVTQPDILMADEPTGNLDSKTGQAVMDLIASLHNDGLTVIVITHETPVANYAERLIKLSDGKIESDHTLDEHAIPEFQK